MTEDLSHSFKEFLVRDELDVPDISVFILTSSDNFGFTRWPKELIPNNDAVLPNSSKRCFVDPGGDASPRTLMAPCRYYAAHEQVLVNGPLYTDTMCNRLSYRC